MFRGTKALIKVLKSTLACQDTHIKYHPCFGLKSRQPLWHQKQGCPNHFTGSMPPIPLHSHNMSIHFLSEVRTASQRELSPSRVVDPNLFGRHDQRAIVIEPSEERNHQVTYGVKQASCAQQSNKCLTCIFCIIPGFEDRGAVTLYTCQYLHHWRSSLPSCSSKKEAPTIAEPPATWSPAMLRCGKSYDLRCSNWAEVPSNRRLRVGSEPNPESTCANSTLWTGPRMCQFIESANSLKFGATLLSNPFILLIFQHLDAITAKL